MIIPVFSSYKMICRYSIMLNSSRQLDFLGDTLEELVVCRELSHNFAKEVPLCE
jgi:hypothetical protein